MDKNKGTPQAFCFITFKDDQVAQRICKDRWVQVEDKRTECKIGKRLPTNQVLSTRRTYKSELETARAKTSPTFVETLRAFKSSG